MYDCQFDYQNCVRRVNQADCLLWKILRRSKETDWEIEVTERTKVFFALFKKKKPGRLAKKAMKKMCQFFPFLL